MPIPSNLGTTLFGASLIPPVITNSGNVRSKRVAPLIGVFIGWGISSVAVGVGAGAGITQAIYRKK